MDFIPCTSDKQHINKPLLQLICPYGTMGNAKAEEIIETFDCLLYGCSQEYQIEFMNNQLMGYLGRDAIGALCHRVFFGRASVCPWCEHKAFHKGKSVREEIADPVRRRWYLRMKTPIYRPDGSVSMLMMLHDITAQKMAKQSLRESERKFSTLMNNLPGMAFSCDIDDIWTLRFASKGCERLLGYLPSELMENKELIIHPDDLTMVHKQINEALKKNEGYQITYRIRTASGQNKWVLEQGEGVYSETFNSPMVEGYITDISEQKKNELRLQKENLRLKNSIKELYRFRDIIGKSPAMQAVYGHILEGANSSVTLIVLGESGTGKELVARAVHDLSDRSEGRFVTVNCGAIPENLFESEFFGYKKGAFSGAIADKKGYLDAAHRGTLFLDEVGEVSIGMQVKLLRAIEGYGYLPVGGHEPRHSDFRIVAATHRNLPELVKKGKMREDFYYRINIFPIHLPPLRERREDIPLLMDHFISGFGSNMGPGTVPGRHEPGETTLEPGNRERRPIPPKLKAFMADKNWPSSLCQLRQRVAPRLSEREKSALVAYCWPGNVRELKNVMERYCVLGSLDFFKEKLRIPPDTVSPLMDLPLQEGGLKDAMGKVEEAIIRSALEKHQWRRIDTARELKITTRTLQRKINYHGLRLAHG
ncbi:MAG: PAS domain-containing protein [Desulfobacteraceae bacterium]|nr:PAS domain-containing protein [Desulfobacteraceae bacterium]